MHRFAIFLRRFLTYKPNFCQLLLLQHINFQYHFACTFRNVNHFFLDFTKPIAHPHLHTIQLNTPLRAALAYRFEAARAQSTLLCTRSAKLIFIAAAGISPHRPHSAPAPNMHAAKIIAPLLPPSYTLCDQINFH